MRNSRKVHLFPFESISSSLLSCLMSIHLSWCFACLNPTCTPLLFHSVWCPSILSNPTSTVWFYTQGPPQTEVWRSIGNQFVSVSETLAHLLKWDGIRGLDSEIFSGSLSIVTQLCPPSSLESGWGVLGKWLGRTYSAGHGQGHL